MALKIAVLPGDGIGKEVTTEAVKVLRAAVEGEQDLVLREGLIGGDAIDTKGDSLPAETLDLARDSDAILLGGAGVAADEQRAPSEMAGYGLLKLRKALTLFANLRPVTLYPELLDASTLKPEVVEGLDMLILRELNGDIYFGEPRGISMNEKNERVGINTMRYSESEIERIARVGFESARKRRGKLCSVDKANVLETMSLWRQVVIEVHADYPDVELSHLFVDAASMALIRDPKQFDVIVTGNMFGDILSDAAAMLAGSIGMLPSASLGSGSFGLYEPVHGTAPDIAGKNIANPLAAILSASMMLRYSFNLEDAADRIEAGVRQVLADGLRTADLRHTGGQTVGTREMGDAVVEAVLRIKTDGIPAAETA